LICGIGYVLGEIETVQLNNEYDLQITVNSMLVNASAGFNMGVAVIQIILVIRYS